MKTSSRIAGQFTLRFALIFGILLFFLNAIFFVGRVRSETQNLRPHTILPPNFQPRNGFGKIVRTTESDTYAQGGQANVLGGERFMLLEKTTFIPTEYTSFMGVDRIRNINKRWWIVGETNTFFVAMDVSQNIDRQIGLLYMSVLMRGIASIGSFFLGRLFVRRSLRDITKLAEKLHHRDITPSGKSKETLLAPHLPDDDEINTIAKAIEALEHRVFGYYANLRTFVSHVSHELKTPLMIMLSDIDVAQQTKKYETTTPILRTHIKDMQEIVETLLTLSRLQEQEHISKTAIPVGKILQECIHVIEKKYHLRPKQHTYESPDDTIFWEGNEGIVKIALINILDNARKYTPENGHIHINLLETSICIRNTGSLSDEAKEHMREPFWQEDKTRIDGIGIGLALVKRICDLHDRNIIYTSEKDTVVCTITQQSFTS